MEKILIINLTDGRVEERAYLYEDYQTYGRGLALRLIQEFVPKKEERYGENNVIVLVPGLFAGCPAPSACRLIVATSRGKGQGMEVCNTTGNLPQKLGSLGIAAVVIRGKAPEKGCVIRITGEGCEILRKEELNGRKTSEIVHMIKEDYGQDCAVIGAGIAADMRLSLSTFFCTYPDGTPEFHCPRNGFGDVFGAKNLRAVVVECNSYFSRECMDRDTFLQAGKSIAKEIVSDEVCGGALPAYGSITLLKILKSRQSIKELTGREKRKDTAVKCSEGKTNYCCAPMCVVGCLNRHSAYEGERYSSPAQSEVMAALEKSYGFDDFELAKQIQDQASEIGIVGTEYVTATKVFAEAEDIQVQPDNLIRLLGEIEKGTLVGRVIASRTYGVAKLYPEKDDLAPWIDRKAILDEPLFRVKLEPPYPELKGYSDLDLLYAQIFVLENLGFCIFTSFALLNKKDIFDRFALLFQAKTGVEMNGETLIRHADLCIRKEREYEAERCGEGLCMDIPPFTKVLYRYFEQK